MASFLDNLKDWIVKGSISSGSLGTGAGTNYKKNLKTAYENSKYIPGYPGQTSATWYTKSTGNKNTQSNTTKNNIDDSAILANALKSYGGGSSSGYSSGGGGVAANKIDVTPMINSYKQHAAQQKKSISDTYASERDLLAQTLKAFQENTATARQNLQSAFNSSRADLEELAFMNNRAAQQSAAARGLGGSGLQQLAQLSNQIQSSKSTSDLAETNTKQQNELTKQLKDKETEISKESQNLTKAERNALAEIDSNVANKIAELQYQEEVRYQEALQAAAAANASIAASRENAASELQAALAGQLDLFKTSALGTFRDGLQKMEAIYNGSDSPKKKKKDLKEQLATTKSALNTLYSDAGIPSADSYLNLYTKQLDNAFNIYNRWS